MSMVFAALALGLSLFPHVLLSSLDIAWSLTIENTGAASNSMVILSWAGLIILPVVVIYQSIGYWIFRKRLHTRSSLHF